MIPPVKLPAGTVSFNTFPPGFIIEASKDKSRSVHDPAIPSRLMVALYIRPETVPMG